MSVKLPTADIIPLFSEHSALWQEENDVGRKWSFELRNPLNPWTAVDFNRALQGLRSISGIAEKVGPDVLEVIAEEGENTGLVLNITDIANITKYCYSESPEMAPHTFKSSVTRLREQIADHFPVQLVSTIKDEKSLKVTVEPARWANVPKYYYIKKTFSYTDKEAGCIYNATMYRFDDVPSTLMKNSNVTSRPLEYEFNMEVIGPASVAATRTPEHILGQVLRFIQIVRREPQILTKEQRDAVVVSYKAAIKTAMDSRPMNDSSKPFFFAPKPVTLEKRHLSNPGAGYGIITIQAGYAVTDKADGERILLFVDGAGDAYMINNALDVFATGLRCSIPNSLIDGEYVVSEKLTNGAPNDLFAAFDVYFVGGENVMALPLFAQNNKPSRVAKMNAVMSPANWETQQKWTHLDLRTKTHVAAEGPAMFAACRHILEEAGDELPYKIDGLIFTPTDLPVFGYYPNRPVKVFRSVRWSRVFKWKPPQQNSIDFLVEEMPETVVDKADGKVTRYRSFKLSTGYNATQWEMITPIQGLKARYERRVRASGADDDDENYIAREFRPVPAFEDGVEYAHIPLDANGRPITDEGEIMTSNQIVEFQYINDRAIPINQRWRALKVRDDKTSLFKKTGNISGTANDFSTAMSIWRSIHDPVSKAAIQGEGSLTVQEGLVEGIEDRLLGSEDVYYDRQVPREHSLSLAMLNFHNQGVKKMLYKKMQGQHSLLELACGKAGDIPRWREAGFSFVLGVDYAKDNIQNPTDGAYARMLRQFKAWRKHAQAPYLDIVFATGDCSKSLRTGAAAAGIDAQSQDILRAVFGNQKRDYMMHVTGRVPNGFDACSCQFAIHYFFQTEGKLNGFLQNVSDLLRVGGYFFGTCMDGELVNNMFETAEKDVVEGMKEGAPIWVLMKRYASYNKEEAYGKTVEVFLEMTNKLIPEYLVNFTTLIDKCREYKLELVESQTFKGSYKSYNNMSPVEQQFSFINRWFVFKRVA